MKVSIRTIQAGILTSKSFLLAMVCLVQGAFGQVPNFHRQDLGGPELYLRVMSQAGAGDGSDPQVDEKASNLYISGTAESVANFSGASAHALVAGEASSTTPINTSTTTPVVDSDLTSNLIADSSTTQGATATSTNNGVNSAIISTSLFTLDGESTQYSLHGTLHLLGAGVGMGNPVNLTTVIGWINDNQVTAALGANGLWTVTGTLPGNPSINYTTSSLNEYFDFVVTANDESDHAFGAEIYHNGFVQSAIDSADATLNFAASASAWAIATPLGGSPTPGDLDGDGDSDVDDFNIVVDGQGTDRPTFFEGDTNRDNLVDVADVQYVLAQSGLSIPGDFNGDLKVDSQDQSLVLLNWGDPISPLPNGWIADLPSAPNIGQDEYDRVLLNWGNDYSAAISAATIPEPSSMILMLGMMLAMFAAVPGDRSSQ